MSAAYRAALNGFIMGSRKILFVDAVHSSSPYKRTLLATIALDVDNHLFDVNYVAVLIKNKKEWFRFMTVLAKCLGGLKPVIILDRNPRLLYAVYGVFGAENHSYYVHIFRRILCQLL